MSYFDLKFGVDFLGHVKNVIINILFFTVYTTDIPQNRIKFECQHVYWSKILIRLLEI